MSFIQCVKVTVMLLDAARLMARVSSDHAITSSTAAAPMVIWPAVDPKRPVSVSTRASTGKAVMDMHTPRNTEKEV
jgi:hypothetical protein